jgi:hypothetical protein
MANADYALKVAKDYRRNRTAGWSGSSFSVTSSMVRTGNCPDATQCLGVPVDLPPKKMPFQRRVQFSLLTGQSDGVRL